jgi:hypothetical protein
MIFDLFEYQASDLDKWYLLILYKNINSRSPSSYITKDEHIKLLKLRPSLLKFNQLFSI